MGNKMRIHTGTLILGALWLLVLPPAWAIGALLAACVHELFHLTAVLACGGQVLSVSILPFGARMETTPLTPVKEALCALAGPLGSFFILLTAEQFPEAALCGIIQGAYNLLPVYPLDGGRILHCLLPTALYRALETFSLTLLTGIGVYIMLQSREVGIIFLIALWNPVIHRKFSCKHHK